jgi:hypothetical protein
MALLDVVKISAPGPDEEPDSYAAKMKLPVIATMIAQIREGVSGIECMREHGLNPAGLVERATSLRRGRQANPYARRQPGSTSSDFGAL